MRGLFFAGWGSGWSGGSGGGRGSQAETKAGEVSEHGKGWSQNSWTDSGKSWKDSSTGAPPALPWDGTHVKCELS